MKNRVLMAIIMIVSVFGFVVGNAIGKNIDMGPEEITMKTAEEKKPAVFPHRKHQDMMGCLECHHARDKDRIMVIDRCGACHNSTMDNNQINSLKKVGHLKCLGCHKKASEEGRISKITCSGCHPLKIKD